MAAAATVTTPQLVDKPGARSAIWQYFGLKTNEQGEAINADAPLCKRCFKTCMAKGGNTLFILKLCAFEKLVFVVFYFIY